MTNLQFHPKVVTEMPANSATASESANSDEALESLRHNQTHTLPPGTRVAWLSHRLQDLPEEHLRATDDLRRAADNAAGLQSGVALHGRSSRRRVAIVLLAGLAAALSGAIAFYVFASERRSGNQVTPMTTHANPTPESVATPTAPEARSVTPAVDPSPAVLGSIGVTREPVAPPRLREPAIQDKPKQAAPQKKAPIKAATSPAEPKAAVDEILFKSR